MKPESEKDVEAYLASRMEVVGGWSIKLPCIFVSGLPDRLCLFPGGRAAFAELKTTKKKAKRHQKYIHRKLEKIGFVVAVLDTKADVKKFILAHVTPK